MKYLVNALVYVALGCILSYSGMGYNTWNYWAVMACTVAAGFVAATWHLW